MSTTLPWPDTAGGTRRHGALLLATALHGALILAALHGLQSSVERPEPREVMISLLSLASEAAPAVSLPTPVPAAPVRSLPQPRTTTPSLPAPVPTVQPQVTPAAVPVAHEVPVAAAPSAPVAEVRSATPPLAAAPAAPAVPVASAVAAAVAPAVRGPVTVSGVEYLSPPKVEYPLSAKRAGIEGKVMLRVLIDEKGQAQRADIQQSSGHARLDDAARSAAMRALFKPHLEDGQPMPVYALIPISFTLK
jgi:protein TonB